MQDETKAGSELSDQLGEAKCRVCGAVIANPNDFSETQRGFYRDGWLCSRKCLDAEIYA